MSAAGFRLGLSPDLAPRLPVALLALAFLGFYWWILNREFGCRTAWLATLILGTTTGWLAYGQVGVTDLPMSSTFAAAMLLALPWIARGDTRLLPAASFLLGLSVLAKGLVPLALAAPLVLRGRGLRDLLRPAVLAPFLIVAMPWYLLCYLKNGWEFVDEFFIRHHFQRITSDALMHMQPWWYYAPALAGLLLPWTPLVPLLARRSVWNDPRRRFLLIWVIFGLVFFSIPVNKLAGYVLPLIPAMAALMALSLDKLETAHWWLTLCAILLIIFPISGPAAPAAVANGISHAGLPQFHWTWLAPAPVVAAAWVLERHGKRVAALAAIAIGATAGIVFLKSMAIPELDRVASARNLWTKIQPHSAEVCVDNITRSWRYGLNYYSVTPLPECSVESRPIRIVQTSGQPPQVVPAGSGLTATHAALYPRLSTLKSRTKP
jgi:4-amino-4-deoxy-L-arabinose transferase-like glycosyltransferase